MKVEQHSPPVTRLPFSVCVVKHLTALAVVAFLMSWLVAARAAEPLADLSRAVIVSADDAPGPERKAVQMLVEEVAKQHDCAGRVRPRPTNDAPVIGASNTAS